MIALPAKRVASTDSAAVMSVTELRVRRWRDVPAVIAVALRLRRSIHRAEGAVVLTLVASPWRRTFWTVSLWTDEEALVRYSASAEHARAVRKLRAALGGARSTRVPYGRSGATSWRQALAALDAVAAGG